MKVLLLLKLCLIFLITNAQSRLKPGFDPGEYGDLLSLAFYNSSIPDSNERLKTKDRYQMAYRSDEVGFKNRWTLYLRDDNVAVIDLRGTVGHAASWMANFYAAMLPATGSLQLNDSVTFNYQLSADPKAMVQAGWTIGVAHMAPGIVEKINAYYRNSSIREFLIFGHSQGGGLAFLVRSYLEYQKIKESIPSDIIFKTYCSAGPKPGNMYYAYDFDFITRNGWAFNVVNAADWVPEAPLSIQTLKDLNPANPLIHTKEALKKQKLAIRVVGGMIYNKLEGMPRKTQKKYEKYLGHVLYKKGVKKVLPQLKEPGYAHGSNYMRAGTPIILMPDAEYNSLFPEKEGHYFVHHLFKPYYFLLKKWYP